VQLHHGNLHGLWRRLALPAFLTLMMAIAMPALPGIDAQESIGSYHGDEHEFYFFYDAAMWELVEKTSEPGVDYVRLEAEQARLEYLAFDAPGMTVEECMIAGVQALADDPAILVMENLYSPGAPPEGWIYGTPATRTFAGAELFLTVDMGGGPFSLAMAHQCRDLAPGQSLLHTTGTVPISPSSRSEAFDRLQAIQYPLIAGYPYDFGAHPQIGPIPVLDASGARMGTFVSRPGCGDEETLVIAKRDAQGAPFIIDPTAFTLIYESGESRPVQVDAWLSLAAHPDQSLDLAPGEIVLFRFARSGEDYELFYTPPDAPPTLVGENRALYCGAGGATTPVLIDLEE
jgi:hypothetical protein